MFKLLKREKGFTLVELMVVALIIGILVGIAVPVFNVARATAQKRTCQANLRTIDGAITTYNATEETYPPAGEIGSGHVLITQHYLKTVPKCPSTATNNQYTVVAGDPSYATCPNGHTY
ncbi:MAG: prepilin-type N-terminal cleavage/methylation domain-containing protein [Actinomycetota bacterium]|nr:prepilin-type N-terminal cleavage/methylation domain-containing protein [Actinomycetota bacterium]